MGIAGGCRIGELVNMKIDDVDDRGNVVVVTLPDTKTNKPRVFTIIEEKDLNALHIYRKYVKLRPQAVPHRRLFLNYQHGKCTVQPVGENKIRKIPCLIATYLKLPEPALYTGHALRRSSASLLVDGGADLLELKRHGGWSSSTVAENYIEDSVTRKMETCKKIFGKNTCLLPVEEPNAPQNISEETGSILTDAVHLNRVVNNELINAAKSTRFESGSIQNCNIFFINQPVQDLTTLLRK